MLPRLLILIFCATDTVDFVMLRSKVFDDYESGHLYTNIAA